MKKYRKLDFLIGHNIETAIEELQEHKKHGELVCGEFNGVMLYSDKDSLDSAYKKITGKTKAQFDKARKKEIERYKEQERRHNEAIPELTKGWIAKGNSILDKKYHENWAKCVPVRLSDLYRGMELGNCLEIVEQLNKGQQLEKVKPLIENQGHSGMSFGLVCAMIRAFCDRGDEFVAYVEQSQNQ